MNNQGANTITGTLALIILTLALIGAITVAVITFKIITKIIKELTNLILRKNQKPNANKQYYPKYSPPKQSYSTNTNIEYYRSTYYLSTHLPYNIVINDKGRFGEYKIFKELRICEQHGARFLFNCYLPKENNKTTEIDIILLTLNGIFVFESKNYSGWIYGSENQETWTQTLPAGNKIHKEHFYNPIIQNKSHIKTLKSFIINDIPIYSVIVFSNNCKLKNITASDPMTEIVTFDYLKSIVTHLSNQQPNSLTQDTIISIYNKLYPYTQVPEEIKQKHAEDVQAKKTRI